jgi:hypothetical protein
VPEAVGAWYRLVRLQGLQVGRGRSKLGGQGAQQAGWAGGGASWLQ